jgi:hypothetical protein
MSVTKFPSFTVICEKIVFSEAFGISHQEKINRFVGVVAFSYNVCIARVFISCLMKISAVIKREMASLHDVKSDTHNVNQLDSVWMDGAVG